MRRLVLDERWCEIPPRMAFLAGKEGRLSNLIAVESKDHLHFEIEKAGFAMYLALGDRFFQLTHMAEVNPGDDMTVRLKWHG